MFHVPKKADYLKILTDDEVKGFVVKNLSQYFKSTQSKFCEEQNITKVAESLYIFLITPMIK